jgi:methionyl-tRNA formyltransferase
VPEAVVTGVDKPQGRGMVLTPSPVKEWALKRTIPVEQPAELNSHILMNMRVSSDVFIVVAYGALLPKELLAVPKHGALNIHPSLLPKYRGPSPVRSSILADDKETGVSIIQMDEKMDHGAIVSQKKIQTAVWPPHATALEHDLIRAGARILAETLPSYINGSLIPEPQDDTSATYCKKIKKEDGFLNLSDNAYENLLKIRAFEGWPGTYTFFEQGGKRLRVKILDAHIENGALCIDRVIPEGKREMPYEEFMRSGASLAK